MSQLKFKEGNNWINIPSGGVGVPSGGNTGEVLTKSSSVDYATEWAELPEPEIPNPNLIIQYGVAGAITTAGGAVQTREVTFPKPFPAAPRVVVSFDSNSTASAFGRVGCSVTGTTATGFTIKVFNGDTSQREPYVTWIAVYNS